MDVKEKKYICDRCGEGFKTDRKWSLLRHIKNVHEGDVNKEDRYLQKKVPGGVHKCKELPGCTYRTNNLRNFQRHIQAKHRLNRVKKMSVLQLSNDEYRKIKKT